MDFAINVRESRICVQPYLYYFGYSMTASQVDMGSNDLGNRAFHFLENFLDHAWFSRVPFHATFNKVCPLLYLPVPELQVELRNSKSQHWTLITLIK